MPAAQEWSITRAQYPTGLPSSKHGAALAAAPDLVALLHAGWEPFAVVKGERGEFVYLRKAACVAAGDCVEASDG